MRCENAALIAISFFYFILPCNVKEIPRMVGGMNTRGAAG